MERVQDKFVDPNAGDGDRRAAVRSDRVGGSQISDVDLLRYVADMLEELQYMCQRTKCSTLLGLLELARAEADLQRPVCVGQRRMA
jgi:hypothetical protein